MAAIEYYWYTKGDGVVLGSEGVVNFNTSDNTSNITVESWGEFITAELADDNTSNITLNSYADVYLGDSVIGGLNSWVMWSDIGSFSFDIDRKNLAGKMPMDWRGDVYSIRKLNKYVMVYGAGGISQLIPNEISYGLNTISKVGIKSGFSITGDDSVHVFIDNKNRLCKLEDGVSILGYEEFLSPMTDPVLSYDNINRLVYICDGTYGYVYSIDDESLGAGPVNITGVNYSNGELYIITSGPIAMPTLEIVTDIIDTGNRKDKTLHEISVGTNLTGNLEASVDFSLSTAGHFVSAGWFPVTPDGIAYVHCFGKEFRVRLRCTTEVPIDLDYLKIEGVVHRYNPLDS